MKLLDVKPTEYNKSERLVWAVVLHRAIRSAAGRLGKRVRQVSVWAG